VQFQELQQATTDTLISVRDQLEQQDANILQIKSSSNNGDDSASVFLAMTAHSVLKDRHIEDLQAQLRTQRLSSTPEAGSVSSNGGGRSGGRGAGGGRGGRSTGRRRSDGPANCTKNIKFYTSSETYCWSCGFDVSKIHDSNTCSYNLQGHQDTATGADTKGGSLKDKEFSKWKRCGWEQQANNIGKKEPDSTTETATCSILKTSTNYKFNTNKLETLSINIAFSNTTLVAICNDEFDSHMRHTIYNHNPNRYTTQPVRSTIKSRQWNPVQHNKNHMKFDRVICEYKRRAEDQKK
jgi:hypothetical protein